MTKETLGVIGGMGPLASAEFVKRVYQKYQFGTEEQGAPNVLLYSDPSIPDRTTEFLKGNTEEIYLRLMKALHILDGAGATQFVICCFTIHHILPLLPDYYKERIISLVDVVLEEVEKRESNYLFLSTTGSRKLDVIKSGTQWPMVKNKIRFLSDEDQVKVHDFIYTHLKMGQYPFAIVEELKAIFKKYNVGGIIAGCTEVHLLTQDENTIFSPFDIIDPLDVIACNPYAWTNALTI